MLSFLNPSAKIFSFLSSLSLLSTMNTKFDHLIPIDFKNALELPDSHTWFHSISSSSSKESIPVIDLDDPQAMNLIKMACENWGVFQVINHGFPITLLDQIEHQTRRFFELPPELKLRALRSPASLTGYGIAPISPFFSKLMWSEGFTINGSPSEHARRVWPQDYSSFCAVIENYQEEMKGLAAKIAALMFQSLGLTREDVEWFEPNELHKSTQAILQLNSYPNCPDPTRAMGLAPHADSSLITLLYQPSTSRGLQVCQHKINWVDVEPISNAIIVNVGDLMQIVSNGRFKSVLHRAIVSKAHHRISVAYFFGPKSDIKISPPFRLIKGGDFPMYQPTSWKEYLDIKAVYFNEALELVRFNPLVMKNNALASGNEAPLTGKTEVIKV